MEKVLSDGQDDGRDKSAADTGSLVHSGIQAYHGKPGGKKHAEAMMGLAAKVFRQGDLEEALSLFSKYVDRHVADQRGTVLLSEEKIEVVLPPVSWDKTQENIVIHGTVDQVRELGRTGPLYVIDHKTSRYSGEDIVKNHMPQLSVYALGIIRRYPNRKVQVFVTRIRDLVRRNLPFWWPVVKLNTEEGCLRVLETVRNRIATLRMASYEHTPGKHCEYCPLVNPLQCDTLELGFRPKIEPKAAPKPTMTMEQLFGGK